MNGKYTEYDIISKFVRFLKEKKNYSDECILNELRLSDDSGKSVGFADLVLFDKRNREYIGLVEFKRNLKPSLMASALVQVDKYKKLMNSPNVKTFLVGLENNELSIYMLSGDDAWVKIAEDDFPNYEALSISSKVKKKSENESNKRKVIDRFKWICFIGASITSLLFILSIMNILTLEAEEMALLGASIGLVVIPYTTKLKILGVEFERNQTNEDN